MVGPQSCLFETIDPASVFRGVEQETHFFCREEYSYEIIQNATKHFNHVSCYLADDTALSLTKKQLPVDDITSEYTLISMRDDPESYNPLLKHNISAPIFVSDISVSTDQFKEFVNAAARAEEIHTDRLHVAILATILGIDVTWYEVGYHKSRGVYEFSLSDKNNIEFVSQNDSLCY